jgi:hypothetical protein
MRGFMASLITLAVDATCNEGRVLFGFLFGGAFMPHEIAGANVSDQVKERTAS